MDSFEKQFVAFLQHYSSCIDRLKPYKMTQTQVEGVFHSLDKSKKGYLDVGDLFEVDSEITEDQLFFIFKWLDTSRFGYVGVEDFKKALQCDKTKESDQYQSEKSFKNYFRILKATFYSIENRKKELNFNELNLSMLYDRIQSSCHRLLSIDSILSYLSNYEPCLSGNITQALEKLLSKEHLTIQTFVDTFKPLGLKVPKILEEKFKTKPQNPYPTLNYASNVDQILRKYENRATPQPNQPIYPQVQKEYLGYQAPADSKLKEQFYGDGYKVSEALYKEKAEKIPYQAEKVLDCDFVRNRSSDIKRRREELKRGSMERKKIIDEIMNKKIPASRNQNLQLDKRYLVETNSNLQRKSKKPYQSYQQGPRQTKIYEDHLKNIDPSLVLKQNDSMQRPSSNPTPETSYSSQMYSIKSSPKNYYQPHVNYESMLLQKENILKRAEEEAAKKIEEIERKARLRVMEKKSAISNVNKWQK